MAAIRTCFDDDDDGDIYIYIVSKEDESQEEAVEEKSRCVTKAGCTR